MITNAPSGRLPTRTCPSASVVNVPTSAPLACCTRIQNTIDGLFANITEESISAFELFGFGKETLQNIQNILTTANFKQNSQEMVYDLLDCLGLGEFSFVAHSYISDGYDDRFRILNA